MCGVVGGHHVESAVVAADSRRENSAGAVYLVEHYLRAAGEDVAYLLPVHEVFALEQRNAGEILERTAYHEVLSVVCAYAGVRVKAFDYWVVIYHSGDSFRILLYIIIPPFPRKTKLFSDRNQHKTDKL